MGKPRESRNAGAGEGADRVAVRVRGDRLEAGERGAGAADDEGGASPVELDVVLDGDRPVGMLSSTADETVPSPWLSSVSAICHSFSLSCKDSQAVAVS